MGTKKIEHKINLEVFDSDDGVLGQIVIEGTKIYIYKKHKQKPSKVVTLESLIKRCDEIEFGSEP